MAWSFSPLRPLPAALKLNTYKSSPPASVTCRHQRPARLLPTCKTTNSEGVAENNGSSGSSVRAQLELLGLLTSTSPSNAGYKNSDDDASRLTIREQLSELIEDGNGEFSLMLGKKMTANIKTLTISQKRNIKRQAYLDKVGRRNDSFFFATIGAFVVLPPIAILSVAIFTGYVQLLP